MAEGRPQHWSGDRRNEMHPEIRKISQDLGKLKDFTEQVFDTEQLVKWADTVGKILAKQIRLKTSQVRKFLDAVNEIRSKGVQYEEQASFFRSQCMLLKPKLAYAAGRQDAVKPFMEILVPCIDKVRTKSDFTRFYRFVEAIIAYHRYHGGRD